MKKTVALVRSIIELRFIERNGYMLEIYDDGFIKVTENKGIYKRLEKLGLTEEAELYKSFPKTGCKTIRMEDRSLQIKTVAM